MNITGQHYFLRRLKIPHIKTRSTAIECKYITTGWPVVIYSSNSAHWKNAFKMRDTEPAQISIIKLFKITVNSNTPIYRKSNFLTKQRYKIKQTNNNV